MLTITPIPTSENAGNSWLINTMGSLAATTYDCENHAVKISTSAGSSNYNWGGDDLRRSLQEPLGPLTTTVWDGSDYLQERI